MSAGSTASTTLNIVIISICCVFAIPLFPNERKSNDGSRLLGIALHLLCSILVVYELKQLFFRAVGLTLRKIRLTELANGIYPEDLRVLKFEHNFLSYFFFFGYLMSKAWDILNYIIFAHNQSECYSGLSLLADISQLTLGCLLILSINIKDAAKRHRSSQWIWGVVGAVCFSAAFKYVVVEVVYGYIDIVEKSIIDPEYGLNITNGTTAEEFVELMFKENVMCLEHVVFPEFVEYILELVPFSTEFFSLATFFCFVSWRNAASNGEAENSESEASSDVLEEQDSHICSNRCSYLPTKWLAILISVLLVTSTIASIWYFYNLTGRREHFGAVWVFISQQLLFQCSLLLTEAIFYFKIMHRMESTVNIPHHFQLDATMLIFPLVPLGVLLTLRVFPDLVQLQVVHQNHLTSSELFWAVVNVFLAVFNYCQVAFQAVFISQVFCRLEVVRAELKHAAYLFLILGTLNFCIWLSWTLECKIVTIHGRTFQIFGAMNWIIIVYATVPFVLFCFAHSTACCFEIMAHCLKRERHSTSIIADRDRDGDAEDDRLIECQEHQ